MPEQDDSRQEQREGTTEWQQVSVYASRNQKLYRWVDGAREDMTAEYANALEARAAAGDAAVLERDRYLEAANLRLTALLDMQARAEAAEQERDWLIAKAEALGPLHGAALRKAVVYFLLGLSKRKVERLLPNTTQEYFA